MTEAEQFAICDAADGNTMLVFSDKHLAARYAIHRAKQGYYGLVAQCHDIREGTGICVMWRDPIPASELEERIANCRWLLEEVLAGRYPKPVPGEVNDLWRGGFPGASA